MTRTQGAVALACAFWLVSVVVALHFRPLLPVDETRYLTVAWEMWRSGDWLVPHLNGETYSHKPPLLFWLIDLGWSVFGVSATWGRLVAPLAALLSLLLTVRLARHLWPEQPRIAGMAALLTVGTLWWTLFGSLTFFDNLLGAAALIALIGLARAWRETGLRGFALFGLGVGLGVLAKGPAILVHVLPVALLAPLWGPALAPRPAGFRWLVWYRGIGLGLVLGILLALAWAIPAGIAGGESYRDAIFWGQSAGRMVESFDHGRPWWWYLAILPALALPWLIWPPAWRALTALPTGWRDGGVRFALCWAVPALLVFSAISGKQPHYLLPEVPAVALLLAALLERRGDTATGHKLDGRLPGFFLTTMGLLLAVVPLIGRAADLGPYVATASPLGGLVAIAGGLALAFGSGRSAGPEANVGKTAAVAAAGLAFLVGLHITAAPVLNRFFDLAPIAQRLAVWQHDGRSLAAVGTYHGQFDFLGRFEYPVREIGKIEGDVAAFAAAHPDGLIISLHDRIPEDPAPLLAHPFRKRFITVWSADHAESDESTVLRPGE